MNTPHPATAASPEALSQQAEAGVRRLEADLGRPFDDNSERLSASLAVLASEQGLSRIDHVVLSERNARVGQGELVFVVQGTLGDPAQLRAHMRTEEAVATPTAQSRERLRQLQEQHLLAMQQVQTRPDPQLSR
ncbi:XVIPCD domain-containing protein [Pseudoxanthomonas winnipegensis]|jgi:hypothetical protein|uniref:X-Tfes XVIPCD domain-containing protein n=1 Tax=Pseudoxanthomonas winnipegensis TaxID=2480810 RepID=A0A4Q8L653_9GAMM|nr:XVIPCD domain-containing protein [Pseudoxanthomonas winnipegensis]TAA23235.1 hypothetical protein EA660_14940 [Pseudoxanthomonas winnipegensis]